MTGAPPSGLLSLVAAALGVVALGACGDVSARIVPTGDVALFVGQVQPILGTRCANPSCHGSEERPLQIYAQMRHRKDGAELHTDAPLTDDELEHNMYSAAAMLLDVEFAHDAPLLTKPLAPAAGGSEHGGDTQFYDVEDTEYVTLLTWARGVVSEIKETEP